MNLFCFSRPHPGRGISAASALIATLAVLASLSVTPARAEVASLDTQRLFSVNSPWTAALPADTPLAPDSAKRLTPLINEVLTKMASGSSPTINADKWSTPIYVVPADQPRVPVTLDNSGALVGIFAAGVPIPVD